MARLIKSSVPYWLAAVAAAATGAGAGSAASHTSRSTANASVASASARAPPPASALLAGLLRVKLRWSTRWWPRNSEAQADMAAAVARAVEVLGEVVDLDAQHRNAGTGVARRQHLHARLRHARFQALRQQLQRRAAPRVVGVGARLLRVGVQQAIVHALRVEHGRAADVGDDDRWRRAGWRCCAAGRRCRRQRAEIIFGRHRAGTGAGAQYAGDDDGAAALEEWMHDGPHLVGAA